MNRILLVVMAMVFFPAASSGCLGEMDSLWGERVAKLKAGDAKRGELFEEGNYAMLIHWGLYSHIGNLYKGKSYYGIGEWIMNSNMAGIAVDEYKALAKEFNPVNFDADEIAKLAKDAGMKYILITAKHHDGFAMYHSKASTFRISRTLRTTIRDFQSDGLTSQNPENTR